MPDFGPGSRFDDLVKQAALPSVKDITTPVRRPVQRRSPAGTATQGYNADPPVEKASIASGLAKDPSNIEWLGAKLDQAGFSPNVRQTALSYGWALANGRQGDFKSIYNEILKRVAGGDLGGMREDVNSYRQQRAGNPGFVPSTSPRPTVSAEQSTLQNLNQNRLNDGRTDIMQDGLVAPLARSVYGAATDKTPQETQQDWSNFARDGKASNPINALLNVLLPISGLTKDSQEWRNKQLGGAMEAGADLVDPVKQAQAVINPVTDSVKHGSAMPALSGVGQLIAAPFTGAYGAGQDIGKGEVGRGAIQLLGAILGGIGLTHGVNAVGGAALEHPALKSAADAGDMRSGINQYGMGGSKRGGGADISMSPQTAADIHGAEIRRLMGTQEPPVIAPKITNSPEVDANAMGGEIRRLMGLVDQPKTPVITFANANKPTVRTNESPTPTNPEPVSPEPVPVASQVVAGDAGVSRGGPVQEAAPKPVGGAGELGPRSTLDEYRASAAKVAASKGKRYADGLVSQARRLAGDTPDELHELRTAGVVTRSPDGKYTLHLVADTDLPPKKWRTASTIDVTDQYAPKSVPQLPSQPEVTPAKQPDLAKSQAVPEEVGPLFTRDEVLVSKPRTTQRKRANGTDGEVKVEVSVPHHATTDEGWARIQHPERTNATVYGRIDFQTGKPPSKSAPIWTIFDSGKQVVESGLTYNDAINKAKAYVESAQGTPNETQTIREEQVGQREGQGEQPQGQEAGQKAEGQVNEENQTINQSRSEAGSTGQTDPAEVTSTPRAKSKQRGAVSVDKGIADKYQGFVNRVAAMGWNAPAGAIRDLAVHVFGSPLEQLKAMGLGDVAKKVARQVVDATANATKLERNLKAGIESAYGKDFRKSAEAQRALGLVDSGTDSIASKVRNGVELTPKERQVWNSVVPISEALRQEGSAAGVPLQFTVGHPSSLDLPTQTKIEWIDDGERKMGFVMGDTPDGGLKLRVGPDETTVLRPGTKASRPIMKESENFVPRMASPEIQKALDARDKTVLGEWADFLVEKGAAASREKAMKLISEDLGPTAEVRSPVESHLRYAQSRLAMPERFYDNNLIRVFTKHIVSASHDIEFSKNWGGDGYGLASAIEDANLNKAVDASGAHEMVARAMGKRPDLNSKGQINAEKVLGMEGAYQVASKLGGNFRSTIRQLTQLASNQAYMGMGNATKALIKVISDPSVRAAIHDSGVSEADHISLMGLDDIAPKVRDLVDTGMKVTGFKQLDLSLRTHAAQTGFYAVEQAIKKANLDKPNAATRFLTDWCEFTPEDIQRMKLGRFTDSDRAMAYKAGVKAQVLSDPASIPVVARTTVGRVFYRLQQFNVAQAKMFGWSLQEAKAGNFTPLARLTAGSIVAGESVIGLLNEFSKVTGQKPQRDETLEHFIKRAIAGGAHPVDIAQRALDDILMSGSLGTYGVVLDAVKNRGRYAPFTPPLVSTGMNALNAVRQKGISTQAAYGFATKDIPAVGQIDRWAHHGRSWSERQKQIKL